MRKIQQAQQVDQRYYTPRAVERRMYEDDVDGVLVEGLGFHRHDPRTDKDIVDRDPSRSGELLARYMGFDDVDFLGLGKKKKSKQERKERREERRDDIRKVFNQAKDKIGDAIDNVGDKIGDTVGDVKGNVKDAISDVKKDPIKALKKGLKEVAHTVLKGAYAVPRAAYLGLIAANFRGFATRIAYADAATKQKIKEQWHKFGGEGENIIEVASKAKDKRPITCGIKCKAKIPGTKKVSFDGQMLLESMTYHGLAGGDDIAIAVATATPVIAAVSKALEAARPGVESAAAIKKALDEVKNDDVNDELERNQMPKSQRDAIDKAWKEAQASADPVNQIKSNPNLTDDEKKAALELLHGGSWSSKKKIVVFGVAAASIAAIIYFMSKSAPATTSTTPTT